MTISDPKLLNLKKILTGPDWAEGAKFMVPFHLLSTFYIEWGKDKRLHSLATWNKFAEEFGEKPALVLMLWDYVRQVQNGGHIQWYDNGYASDQEGAPNDDDNNALQKHMIDLFDKNDTQEMPACSEVISICRLARPALSKIESSVLDMNLWNLGDECLFEIAQFTKDMLDLGIEMVKDESERRDGYYKFIDQLPKSEPRGISIPTSIFSKESIEKFNKRMGAQQKETEVGPSLAEQTRHVLATLTPDEEKRLQSAFGMGEKSIDEQSQKNRESKPIKSDSKIINLKKILISPDWSEGAHVMSVSELVSLYFYESTLPRRQYLGSTPEMHRFIEEYGESAALTVMMRSYMVEVQNYSLYSLKEPPQFEQFHPNHMGTDSELQELMKELFYNSPLREEWACKQLIQSMDWKSPSVGSIAFEKLLGGVVQEQPEEKNEHRELFKKLQAFSDFFFIELEEWIGGLLQLDVKPISEGPERKERSEKFQKEIRKKIEETIPPYQEKMCGGAVDCMDYLLEHSNLPTYEEFLKLSEDAAKFSREDFDFLIYIFGIRARPIYEF